MGCVGLERFAHQESETLLNTGGMLTRVFQPLFRLLTKDWHMLLLGFLFGAWLRHGDGD